MKSVGPGDKPGVKRGPCAWGAALSSHHHPCPSPSQAAHGIGFSPFPAATPWHRGALNTPIQTAQAEAGIRELTPLAAPRGTAPSLDQMEEPVAGPGGLGRAARCERSSRCLRSPAGSRLSVSHARLELIRAWLGASPELLWPQLRTISKQNGLQTSGEMKKGAEQRAGPGLQLILRHVPLPQRSAAAPQWQRPHGAE